MARTIFKLKEFEKRPVKQHDINSWCVQLEQQDDNEAPNGYVVRIPNPFNGMILRMDGTVKKFKQLGTTLYLQVDQKNCILEKGYRVSYDNTQIAVNRI